MKMIFTIIFFISLIATFVITYRSLFRKPFWLAILKCWGMLIVTFFFLIFVFPPSEQQSGNDTIQGLGVMIFAGWAYAIVFCLIIAFIKMVIQSLFPKKILRIPEEEVS